MEVFIVLQGKETLIGGEWYIPWDIGGVFRNREDAVNYTLAADHELTFSIIREEVS